MSIYMETLYVCLTLYYKFCLTSTSCLLLLLLYAARTMNHMMRETRRKVAGTAVTTIEASKMPCKITLKCISLYKTFIHLEVQVDAKQ